MLAFHAAAVPASNSFGISLKGTRLPCGKEVLVFSYACPTSESPCAMHHYWSGGSFAGYAATRIRYYYDGSMLSLPLGPAHGMSPTSMDDNAPWSAGSLFGKTGKGLFSRPVSVWSELGLGSKGSGLFNNFLVPFAVTMNVTATLGCPQNERGSYWEPFWIILHGHTRAVDLRLTGGLRLPEGARLRSYESPVVTMDPFEFLVIFNTTSRISTHLKHTYRSKKDFFATADGVRTSRSEQHLFATAGEGGTKPAIAHGQQRGGAVLLVSLSVSADSSAFLEGCMRAASIAPLAAKAPSGGGEDKSRGGVHEWLYSSGTEDYFLGTFYFDKGQYMQPLAGVTSFCGMGDSMLNATSKSVGCVPPKDGSLHFSAYRVHAGLDPLTFDSSSTQGSTDLEHRGGFALSWRNGEPGRRPHVTARASSFALVYEW